MIRTATEADAEAVVALWTEAYFTEGEGGRDSPYARSDFEQTQAAAAHLLVAERGARESVAPWPTAAPSWPEAKAGRRSHSGAALISAPATAYMSRSAMSANRSATAPTRPASSGSSSALR